MSTMQSSLVLTGDAQGLAAAARDGQSAIANLNREIERSQTGFKSAGTSAEVFTRALDQQERELDKLRASLDPSYVATQRLEAGERLLAEALKSGTVAAEVHDAVLNKLRAQYTAIVAPLDQVARSEKSAADSADVFTQALDRQEREIDQLSASLDPAYAATRRLEAGQELLSRAYASGAITLQKYEATQELLQAQYRQTTQAIELQNAAVGRLTTRTAGGAGGVQNFAFQLQDVFTQIGMGVPLMISLGQQAPQLLSGFGSVGAILGVVAAGAFPLTAALFGLGYQTDQTKEKILTAEDLISDALSRIGDAQAVLRENSVQNLDDIAGKYGEVTASVLTLMQAQNELALQDALKTTRDAINTSFDDLRGSELGQVLAQRRRAVEGFQSELSRLEAQIPVTVDRERLEAEIERTRAFLERALSFEGISERFEIGAGSLANFDALAEEIDAALNAGNFDQVLETITAMRRTLQSIPDGPLRDMLAGIVNSEDALRQALHTAELNAETQQEIERLLTRVGDIDVSSNLAAAADQATRIADELNRAVQNAAALASQGVGGLERARINYEFRDDPVGRAGALAGAEFDSRASVAPGTDSTIRNVIEAERREFVAARVEAERYNQALAAWRKSQRDGARGGARAARDAARDRKRILKDVETQIKRLAPSYARDVAALNTWRDEALAALTPAAQGYEAFVANVETIFEKRLAEAYRADLDRREDWKAGFERAFLDVEDRMLTWADVTETITENWLQGGEDAFVRWAKTGKFQIGDLVDFAIEQFARLAYQRALQPALAPLFDGIISAVTGALGLPGATQSHAGSQIGTSGVRRSYGPGAPLRADERLTVTTLGQRVFTPSQIANGATVVDALAAAAAKPHAASMPVTFAPVLRIENRSSTQVQGDVEQTTGPGGQRLYKFVLADAVGDALTQPGGGARRNMRQGYGLQPARPAR